MYLGAIFVTCFALGEMMLLGVNTFLPSLGNVLGGRIGLIAQSLVELALLVYSLTASTDDQPTRDVPAPSASTYAALALLGITVTVMELPTAIPYFAAVALITEAALPIQTWAPLLGLYNLIFVLPPIALLVGHLFLGRRLAERYAALRRRLQREARQTTLWIAGLVGGGLFVTGIIESLARLR